MSQVPMGWKTVKLADVCIFENGDRGKNYPGRKAFVAQGIPFINAGHLSEDGISMTTMNYIPRKKFDLLGSGKVQEGDLLFCLRGSLGKFAVVEELQEGAIASSLVIVRADSDKLNRYFLSAYFGSRICSDMIDKYKNGAAQPNLSAKSLGLFQIPLPPLPEQKRIVAILDKAFEGINQAVANAEKNLANARELFESYLNNIFTQKGEGWVEKKLGEVCNIRHGFAFKSKFFAPAGDYVVLTPGSFYESGGFRGQGAKTKYYFGEIPDGYILKKGAFLIAMTEQAVGLLGSSLIVPEPDRFLHNQRLGLVEVNDNINWDNDFFHHQLNTRYFRDSVQATASGVKVRHTSPKKLYEIPVACPKQLSKQKQIASELNELNLQTQHLQSIYQQKLNNLQELKQSILQKAFSGELTGNQQNQGEMC